jgi:hypothetical protein
MSAWYPIALVSIAAAFWGVGVWTVVTEEPPKPSKWQPMPPDEEAAQELYRRQDRAKTDAMRANRYREIQYWEMHLQEARHIWYIRQFRRMWDGTITIGEDAACTKSSKSKGPS